MKKEEAQELLKRYRLGQCTEKEIEIINQWYNSFDETEADLFEEDTLRNTKKEMLENINRKICQAGENEKVREGSGDPIRRMVFLRYENLRRMAAVLLVGVVLAFFFYNRTEETLVDSEVSTEKSINDEMLPTTIFLSDGSKVRLKGDSRLEYPTSFTGDTREVILIGEAFFEVAKNKEKPFIIHSTAVVTKVLGTSFNIKAYEDDESVEVTVVTGQVSVSLKDDTDQTEEELFLTPNQKAVYSRKDDVLVQTEVDEIINYHQDLKTKLIFNETPLENILEVLNDYYKVNITLENQDLKNCLITAELTNEPLEVSLKILTKAIGAEYIQNGEEIIISGKGCGL